MKPQASVDPLLVSLKNTKEGKLAVVAAELCEATTKLHRQLGIRHPHAALFSSLAKELTTKTQVEDAFMAAYENIVILRQAAKDLCEKDKGLKPQIISMKLNEAWKALPTRSPK